ncbi:MAG: glycosyltransferase family 9 protein [Parachlamydiales bacterium]
MRSILLVRTSAIGDVVQTFPVIEYLRSKFPAARIDWVVEKGIAPLLRQLKTSCSDRPLIDQVIEVESKKWAASFWLKQSRSAFKDFVQRLRMNEYDAVFDLQGNSKSAMITMLAKGKDKVGFGWNSVREKPNLLATTHRYEFPLDLNIREKYLKLVQSYYGDEVAFVSKGIEFQLSDREADRLRMLLEDPLMQHPFKLMVAVGSKWNNKKLSDDALVSLLKEAQLRTDAALVLIYGSVEEKLFAEKLLSLFPNNAIAVGDLTLPLWQALMHHVDGIIAVDSAALHFAGTTKTPSFSVFGPTSAHIFKPLEQQHHAFQGACPYGKTFHKQCPILRSCASGACIRNLTLDQLEAPFTNWLSGLLSEQQIK